MDIELILLVLLPVIFFVIGFFVGKASSLRFDGYLHVVDVGDKDPALLLDIPSFDVVSKQIVVLKTLKGEKK